MKKIFSLFFLTVLFLPFVTLAGQYQADNHTVTYEGLVPCGREMLVDGLKQSVSCQPCHILVLIDSIIDFLFKFIIFPLAVLLLVAGGIMFFLAAERPEMIERAKSLLKSVVIGLGIALGAFLLIGFFLNMIGLASWAENIYQGWLQGNFFAINCPVPLAVGPTPVTPVTPTVPDGPVAPDVPRPPDL